MFIGSIKRTVDDDTTRTENPAPAVKQVAVRTPETPVHDVSNEPGKMTNV